MIFVAGVPATRVVIVRGFAMPMGPPTQTTESDAANGALDSAPLADELATSFHLTVVTSYTTFTKSTTMAHLAGVPLLTRHYPTCT